MRIARLTRTTKLLLIALLAVLLLAPERLATADETSRLKSIVGLREFDYLVWEVAAFGNKGLALLTNGHRFLPEETRSQVVLDYLDLVREAQAVEREIELLYGDPNIVDPALASQSLQADLLALRAEVAAKQPLAEAIVQQQVATILAEQGFTALGGTWPPVLMHVSPLPELLVVSPRDRIEKKYQVSLTDGLAVTDHEEIETAVLNDLDHAGLVVPLGGIGTYPAMIVETSDINRLVEVVAHEWTHHWLTLKPLGFNYAANADTRIMNETVASLVDQELGRLVVERYYPEYLASPAPEPPPDEAEPEQPAFDFQQELADTRARVDDLLAAGEVEEAESYMEARRQVFRDNGYHIRKLNQAFFAFYGAYAAEPGGAQGLNPIGPMLRDIRVASPSIRVFLDQVAPLTSFAELETLYQRLGGEALRQ